jgi:hypothetical protein
VIRARWLRLLLQTALGAALIGVLLWQTDVERAYRVARDGEYLYLLPVFPMYLLGSLCNAFRWRLALHAVKEPPPSATCSASTSLP